MQQSTFKTLFGYNKAKPNIECSRMSPNVAVACWLRSFTKTFNGNLRLCLYTPLKSMQIR